MGGAMTGTQDRPGAGAASTAGWGGGRADAGNAYDVELGSYIDGTWRTGQSHDAMEVIDPSSGAVLGLLPLAGPGDLDRALDAAARGFAQWRHAPPEQRGAILGRAAALLRERTDRIARIATLEQGKPLAEAKDEIAYAAALLDFQAGEALRIYGRVLPRPAGVRSLVLKQPVGPVVAFSPWNFPVLNVVRKLAPAIASGCSIILKPSEETPGSAIEVMRCLIDAGLPGPVAQLVFGVPDQVSRQLLASPITRKLSFTGSVPVGKHLLRLAADTVMRTTMELGGHAPVLVFDDCDLEATLDMLVAAKFRNAGQVCVSPTRFYVQKSIHEPFIDGFVQRVEALSVGPGIEPETRMGPLANPRRQQGVAGLVADARAAGATLVVGGERMVDRPGYFFAPTVLADVPLDARVMNEEPFGPLALVRWFEDADEAIALANRLPFGLAAYGFTQSGRRQNLLADRIEAGIVAINSVRMSWADAPFGGLKESGFGSEDGPEGVEAHLVTRAVHIA